MSSTSARSAAALYNACIFKLSSGLVSPILRPIARPLSVRLRPASSVRNGETVPWFPYHRLRCLSIDGKRVHCTIMVYVQAQNKPEVASTVQ